MGFGFLAVCLFPTEKSIPTPRKKSIRCGKKSGPNATFDAILQGLGWPWVFGEFVGFITIFTCFPTQQNFGTSQNTLLLMCDQCIVRCTININFNALIPYLFLSSPLVPSPFFSLPSTRMIVITQTRGHIEGSSSSSPCLLYTSPSPRD